MGPILISMRSPKFKSISIRTEDYDALGTLAAQYDGKLISMVGAALRGWSMLTPSQQLQALSGRTTATPTHPAAPSLSNPIEEAANAVEATGRMVGMAVDVMSDGRITPEEAGEFARAANGAKRDLDEAVAALAARV